MESFCLPATLPLPLRCVHLAHFSNLETVTSAKILQRIIDASKLPLTETADQERAQLDYAFIDPTRICGKLHIVTAVTQAALVCARSSIPPSTNSSSTSTGGMKTKTPHSEIIYMLSPGNNVGEALKRFGLSSDSTSLLLVKFSTVEADRSDILRQMTGLVNHAAQTCQAQLTAATCSDSSQIGIDIETAIRYGRGRLPTATVTDPPPHLVTDWKQLNKIYKLEMPSTLLTSVSSKNPLHPLLEQQLEKYREIICTLVAMKLVAG